MITLTIIIICSYIITFIFTSIGENIDIDEKWYPAPKEIRIIFLVAPILNMLITLLALIEIIHDYKKLF